nr:hypothetical protein [Lactobacillus paragasseri]
MVEKIYNLFKSHIYVWKRLFFAFVLSIVELVFVTLWYAVNFQNNQKNIRDFLKLLKIFMTPSAENFCSFLCVFVIAVLLVVVLTQKNVMSEKLNGKIDSLKTLSKNDTEELKKEKDKNIFQCYTWGLTLVVLLLAICRVIKWSAATTFTLLMEIFLWLILFTLSLIVILIASVVLEWLEKDNTQTGGIPRTAIFLGFVATVLAAILKH